MVNPFRIIAHRGASGYAPENTMAAFKRAVEMGCDEVETDVQFTKDRQVLLFHDGTLDRTTDGFGLPQDFTMDELKRLDAGSWWDPAKPRQPWEPELTWDRDYPGERVITLEEMFERFADTLTYHVEIKDYEEGLVPATIAIIEKYGLADNCFITAIDKRSALEAREVAPHIRVGWAVPGGFTKETLGEAVRQGFAQVINMAHESNPEVVKYGHELGLEIRSSAIRDRDAMIRAVETGCNGMTINWPDWLMEYMKGR